VEHIAQSAAAGLGVRCSRCAEAVPLGFIASIRDLTIHALPPVGATLKTKVKVTNIILNISIVNGEAYCGEQLIAACEMRIFAEQNECVCLKHE
jgi:hypothetical protein